MVAPLGPYSPAVKAGGFIFVSGQIGRNAASDHLEEGLALQAHQAILNLKAVLKENGADLLNVVKTTVYVLDMSGFSMMNDVYAEAFGEHRPARATVAVHGLPAGALFEIEAVAYVG